MKKAVFSSGGKQYLVSEGDTVDIELIPDTKDKLNFDAMLLIDGDKIKVGTPLSFWC